MASRAARARTGAIRAALDGSGASFSPCGTFRYSLFRRLSMWGAPVAFLMHNPSTADAVANDPTITRAIDFAQQLDAGEFFALNRFALRSTDPDALWLASDPVGPDNDAVIEAVLRHIVERNGVLIVAWGDFRKTLRAREAIDRRSLRLLELAEAAGAAPHALATCGPGIPKHPLYLSRRCKPTRLRWRESSWFANLEA